jgi:hypothetical protein
MRGIGRETEEAKRIANLMANRHRFPSLDRDMIDEVAYFIFVATVSYNRLTVYNPSSAEKIYSDIARLKAHLRDTRQTLIEEETGQEILFRMSQRVGGKSPLASGHNGYVNITRKIDRMLSKVLFLLADGPISNATETKSFNDPTWPFAHNLELIRSDIASTIDIGRIAFNEEKRNFPNHNQWLSGYALPVVYFTTYFDRRVGGSAADGKDKVGPLFTFVQELFQFISGRKIRGDTILKNKRLFLDQRLHWSL